MVEAERTLGGATSREARSYLSSLSGEAGRVGGAVRAHWGSENRAHWILAIAFAEDACRVRRGEAAQDFAILRRVALNRPRRERTATVGIKAKRLKAGGDEQHLLRVLAP
jgi:predicted transposase YbfD/YdcC